MVLCYSYAYQNLATNYNMVIYIAICQIAFLLNEHDISLCTLLTLFYGIVYTANYECYLFSLLNYGQSNKDQATVSISYFVPVTEMNFEYTDCLHHNHLSTPSCLLDLVSRCCFLCVFLLWWLMNMITVISGVLTVKTEQILTALVLIFLCNIAPARLKLNFCVLY